MKYGSQPPRVQFGLTQYHDALPTPNNFDTLALWKIFILWPNRMSKYLRGRDFTKGQKQSEEILERRQKIFEKSIVSYLNNVLEH
ncbi:hypothetical protein Zmor_026227 [Zophobas morio]|uniref:Uncharacterized protein n=1 Tax=Zophobas morio TaxID=2755281 RepID=A0AA38M5T1_9CUCU|nr:hypothetical protein Zmor_026227 [Zophobas morio]